MDKTLSEQVERESRQLKKGLSLSDPHVALYSLYLLCSICLFSGSFLPSYMIHP